MRNGHPISLSVQQRQYRGRAGRLSWRQQTPPLLSRRAAATDFSSRSENGSERGISGSREQPAERTAIEQDGDPEHALEGGLAGLVAEQPLGGQRARPSADQSEQMQGVLGGTPPVVLCRGFV